MEISQVFGFHPFKVDPKTSASRAKVEKIPNKQLLTANNVANVIGWFFPLLGAGRAAFYTFKYFTAYKDSDSKRAFALTQIARGGLEFIGLGVFLFFVDMAVSAKRYGWCCLSENAAI